MLILAGVWPGHAHAADDDLQVWPTFTVYTPTVNGWRGSVELHVRWTEDVSTFERAVYRVNGGRLFGNGLELLAGYERTQSGTHDVGDEHRLWEQIEHTIRRGPWSVANRVRLEERFVDDAGRTAYRLRYRFRVQHGIGRKWLLGVGQELWLHLNTVPLVGSQGVDQNRITLTAARGLSRHLSIEPGYMFIYAKETPPLADEVAHAITLQATARF